LELTFQKGQGSKIFISKLTCNNKALNAFSVNDVECYNDYFSVEFGNVKRNTSAILPSDLVIPNTYKGKTITHISNRGFEGCENLRQLTVQEGIKGIGQFTFYGCINIERIILPNSLTTFSANAFSHCYTLTTIVFPDGVINIGVAAFDQCTNLSTIIIPNNEILIYGNAFVNCTNLSKVYYKGTKNEWDTNITIKEYNGGKGEELLNATRYYYSETKPTEEGNYWHYVDGEIIEWGGVCENGHTWKESPCMAKTCMVCGTTRGSARYPHTFGAWAIITEAGCESEGLDGRQCIYCGYSEYREIERGEHKYKEIRVEPTCAEEGSISNKCEVCGNEKDKVVIEKLPHTWGEWNITLEPTCLATGMQECSCENCSESKSQVLDKIEHTWVDATCAKKKHCSVCGEEVGEFSPHTYSETYTEATCTDDAYKTFTCSECGHSYIESEPGTASHKWSDWRLNEEEQKESRECSVCHEIEERTPMFLYDLLEDGTYSVKAGEGLSGDIRIPSSYKGKAVTQITKDGFDGRQIETVVIPNTVQIINYEAFAHCDNLTMVIIGDGVETIGNSAFYRCTKLDSIVIGSGVTYCDQYAFLSCNNIKNVYYKGTKEKWDKIEYYDNSSKPHEKATVYYYCETAPTDDGNYWYWVDDKPKVWSIAKYFDYVEQDDGTWSVTLKPDIDIPDEIEIPSQYNGRYVTTIGDDAFSGRKNLKTVILNEGVERIGHRAFKGCSSIENLVFPDSVTYIGHETLNGCSGIVSIVLPYIGNFDWKNENHFYEYPLGYHFGTEEYEGGVATEQEYYNFWDINDPGTLLETRTFYIPEGLRTVEVHRGNILHGCFQNCKGITKVTLPTEIDKIGKNSFLNCENLEELIIPVTLQEIDYSAFEGCSKVIIQYYGDTTKYRIENNCLVEVLEDGTEEVIFGNQNSEIPSTASSVSAGAFYGNTYFAPIKIPLSVTDIGSLAFGGKPVMVYVPYNQDEIPSGWADDWCDDSVTVVWGYKDKPLEHDYEEIERVEQTCVKDGYIRYTCSTCGLTYDEVIKADGVHSYSRRVVEPTCTKRGYTVSTCDDCGTQTYKDYTDPLGHKYTSVITTEPTCTKIGVRTSTCIRCGDIKRSGVPALGHDWDEGFVRIEPTCTTNGVRRHICTRCGDTVEVGISALRHDWGEWRHVHPVECEIDGTDSRYCKRCGEEEIRNVPAEGHDWGIDVTVVEPTCTEQGYTIYPCNNCAETHYDDYVPALGHNIVDGICTRCGYSEKGIVYYGVSAIPERYNSSFVLGLTNKTPSDSHLESISATPLEGEYIYYCAPTSFGDCAFAYNNFIGGFTLIIEGIALTNAGGRTEAYNIYKSNQANLGANGAITITIKEMG
jgi:hypothetical protein